MAKDHLPELAGPLRSAVEQVQNDPLPRDALERTLKNVRNLRPHLRRPPRWRPRDFTLAAIIGTAAGILVGVFALLSEADVNHAAPHDPGADPNDQRPGVTTVAVAPQGRPVLDVPPRGPGADAWLRGNEGAASEEPLDLARTTPSSEHTLRIINGGHEIIVPYQKLNGGGYYGEPYRAGIISAALKAKNELPDRVPYVWKRDVQRPTVARVYGGGLALQLVSLQVTVVVEGPRARTLVDHIFRNPHDRALEGTFEYPLPLGACPSYFALFPGQVRDTAPPRFVSPGNVPALPADRLAQLPPEQMIQHVSTADWGAPQVARVVGKERARETSENGVRTRLDPALLDYAGGNTFSGRISSVPAKGYNRVVIAYEELLPVNGEQVVYRFPLPDSKLRDLQFDLYASAESCKNLVFQPADAKQEEANGRLAFHKNWTEQAPGGEVQFAHTPAIPTVQAISTLVGPGDGAYVYARLRPQLKARESRPFADRAVFLLDTSLSEHPDRFAVNMQLLRKILETDPDIRQFNILTFNTGAAWVEPNGWMSNSLADRTRAFALLDGLVLEGATDLSAALARLARPSFETTGNVSTNVFLLSDGQITWGESDVNGLVSRFEAGSNLRTRFHCYRTGVGADNLELFEALTRRGGGIFNCFGESDLPAVAVAHRRQCLTVEKVSFVSGPAATDLLVAGRKAAVYPGGELVVAGKLAGTGRAVVRLEGTFQGQKFAEDYPVEVTGAGELAGRGWAEIAVASLLGLNDPTLDPLVTAYCQHFGIGCRVASFLVPEKGDEFRRFNLNAERRKVMTSDFDFSRFLARTNASTVSPRTAFDRLLARVAPPIKLYESTESDCLQTLLDILPDSDFALPDAPVAGAVLRRSDVPTRYLTDRDASRRSVEVYLAEAQRRAAAKDTDGAVRVLSSIVEEYPGRGDALRLVAYRLLDLNRPADAVRLFARVQRQRPFEPQSYLDLARGLEQSGKYGLAAIQYEIALAGTWDTRFPPTFKGAAREDYRRMMQQASLDKTVDPALAAHFGARLQLLEFNREPARR